ncbi:hypothetical protein AXG93_4620s2010 [Marchantia polymorpha subsp. ruderalis]|uniref:Uncharacterized protein n=1 Tax=Marchantia polymorpha subsp. ruderalis TaxID=1480154 RepID=A0A176VZN2_MARPO|nr:hypothetical protein AXG93_4620s2010 [Marchantia polymorpha subsp. ruderalis]
MAEHDAQLRSMHPRKRNETLRLIVTTFLSIALGFFIGIFFIRFGLTNGFGNGIFMADDVHKYDPMSSVPSRHPRGTEGLPLGIIIPESDLYQRRLWGKPDEDLPANPSKHLVTFTVGIKQKDIVNKAVQKELNFDPAIRVSSEFFQDLLTDTETWYAKRFLHPDIVAPYDYIFIWDEDLGVDHFDGEKYIELVKKYGLEISQPALEPDRGLTWQMTKRRSDVEVHKITEERPGWCKDPNLPPCAGFVEIMAPVFSRKAWRCVWHMIQNDLVHGWGLDMSMRRCVEGESKDGRQPWEGVRERCRYEWRLFTDRIEAAEKDPTPV